MKFRRVISRLRRRTVCRRQRRMVDRRRVTHRLVRSYSAKIPFTTLRHVHRPRPSRRLICPGPVHRPVCRPNKRSRVTLPPVRGEPFTRRLTYSPYRSNILPVQMKHSGRAACLRWKCRKLWRSIYRYYRLHRNRPVFRIPHRPARMNPHRSLRSDIARRHGPDCAIRIPARTHTAPAAITWEPEPSKPVKPAPGSAVVGPPAP